MAIFHLHVRAGSRGGGGRTGAGRVIKGKAAGQSARAKAAYNLRVQEYAANRHELAYTASGNMPAWADDAMGYWEATDTHERAKATLFREVEFALPHELPAAERHRLAHEFMASICDAQGLPYLLTVHEKPGNSHAHGLISERMHDGYDRTPETWFRRAANQGKEPGTGGARKARLGQDGSWLQSTRSTWSAMCNNALELHGHAVRIDHRSFADQGITDRLPQIHLGPHIGAMEERGIRTERAERAFEIAAANKAAKELQHGRSFGQDQEREVRGRLGERGGADVLGHGHDGRGLEGADSGDRERDPSRVGVDDIRMEDGARGHVEGHERERGADAEPRGRDEGHSEVRPVGGEDREGLDRERPVLGHDEGYDDGSLVRTWDVRRIVDMAQIERPESMKKKPDWTRIAVERQLLGMKCKTYEVGISDPKKGMLIKQWTPDEVMKSMDYLRSQNAKGANIYIRPGEKDRGLLLADDLNLGSLERMKSEGLTPAVITETSPGNYQAWVRVCPRNEALESREHTLAAKALAARFGGDPNSADFRHFGRLAGFTNRKPEHMRGTMSPFVRLDSYKGAEASPEAVKQIMAEGKRISGLQHEVKVAEHVQQLDPKGVDRVRPWNWYRKGLESLKNEFGPEFNASRADFELGQAMYRNGAKPRDICATLLNYSPQLEERKGSLERQKEYTFWTVAKVVARQEMIDSGRKFGSEEEFKAVVKARTHELVAGVGEDYEKNWKAPAPEQSRSYGMSR